jgi:hypothetical protein
MALLLSVFKTVCPRIMHFKMHYAAALKIPSKLSMKYSGHLSLVLNAALLNSCTLAAFQRPLLCNTCTLIELVGALQQQAPHIHHCCAAITCIAIDTCWQLSANKQTMARNAVDTQFRSV